MPTEVLAPGKTVADSSDITVSGATPVTIALYNALDDNFLLADSHPTYKGDFLLPNGVDILLLPTQSGEHTPWDVNLPIFLKDPLGEYNPTGQFLNGRTPTAVLTPGVWRVSRDKVTSVKVGVQKD